jgi:type II secretory pathway pseudopilin PulG
MGLAGQGRSADQRGYAMAALLVSMSVMAVLMGAALPVWSHATQREREEELIWRGEQYRRAIMLFQRKYANTFPPTVDILVEQKFLRKKYKDPVTDDEFQLIPVGGGQPGVPGFGGNTAGGSQPGLTQPGAGAPPGGNPSAGFGAPGNAGGAGGAGAFGQQPATQPSGFGSGTSGTQLSMGIQGVTSKSKKTSIKLYNGMNTYNQWAFVYLAASTQAGAGGQNFGRPGQTGGFGQPGGQGGFGQPGGQGGFGQPGGQGGFGQPGGGFGQPPQPGGGFGQPPQPGGGFGQPAQPGGGFGQPAQPGGGFGQPAQPGGFGQPGAVGQPTMPPVPGGGFGQPGGPGQPRPPGTGPPVFVPTRPPPE